MEAAQRPLESPWWYRGRTWVFALLYFAGFFFGAVVSKVVHGTYVAAFRELGADLGPSGPDALLIFACVCAAICYGWRVWGSSYLRAGTVWNPGALSDQLVIAGPFRFLRNPLYFGNFFLAIGIGLLAPVTGFVFILVSNVLFVMALARHEEAVLEGTYGERFRKYAARVPPLFPRLWPVAQEGDARPSLVQGLLAEVFTGALMMGLVLSFVDRRHGMIDFFGLYFAGLIAQRAIAAGSSR
ncbi:MAG TPA: isoprenylcysteine carboxylmethyltransferase family protein [Candidatus Rubrimentiphilum sp.]|nr:isoprenylcysteine carboxylmethyltransferase family protein [Candidatus Rubrimentiphilum sp.]